MKPIKVILVCLCAAFILSCSQKDAVNPASKVSDTQVVGRWNLIRIVNGFAQSTTIPSEVGISEVIEYKADGTYQRNYTDTFGQHEEKGNFYTGANPTKTADKQAVFYPDDKTAQPYTFQDGHLFLYQRGSQDATIADGSTYEYQRQ
ncbi:hypothetical protein [Spirosoma sp. KNUC1025]|uniref:hypothetical protein n=1 Tax=Spirosoma sp. KNUC1025 TaxID=2894082 RepID=UPI003865FE6F|nr:hypothetical protein LN737_03430 [Spirosoma sp. KNUC1025]